MPEPVSDAIRSTCPYCGVGCGVLLRPGTDGSLAVEGDPDHPANFGRLCSKGLALGETVDLEGRLLFPQVRGVRAGWDAALEEVAARFSATIEEHGPDSVAFYVSGQLLTEDYYVANKLMKGFIGSGNIDTNSRLCMASTVAGHKRAFGTDTVPGSYEDIERADLVLLVGSNLAWCHPVLFQRLKVAREAHGTKVVVIDPRRTASCAIADLHLPLKTGTDVALFNGLLAYLAVHGHIDEGFAGAHTSGLAAALETARADDPAITGLSPQDLQAFYALFAATEKTVTLFSQGVNQSSQGTDKVNAIINCHLATGRIGRAGMGPLSATGQPNAMGGREVGGLANMLAAHLDIENPEHSGAVRQFWNAPNMAQHQGLKAVDMFDAVHDGRIKALWIACTNPAVSMPEAGKVAEAIARCDFTVVSDMYAATDTAKLADIVLPALGWGEKDGTVTNSDRTISRQRAALPPPGAARADWDIFAEVGRRMGWEEAFSYTSAAQIFREHAALSGIAGQLGKDFDISACAGLSDADFEAFAPATWPLTAHRSGGRFFAEGAFFTPTGRANLVAVTAKPPAQKTAPRYPFRLNTGRSRDQWHTMTRTARSARLSRHLAEPFLQIHPLDAHQVGLQAADIARVSSPSGAALLRVLISQDASQGAPFAPMHWTAEYAPAARICTAVAAELDPVSGQPESKATPVAITKFEAAWYGFAISQGPLDPDATYFAKSRVEGGWQAELAGETQPDDWSAFAARLFGRTEAPLTVEDQSNHLTRLAFFDGCTLTAALFVSASPVLLDRGFALSCLGRPSGGEVLAARPPGDRPAPGPLVCSCMNVGQNTILGAIFSGCTSLEAVGTACGAGTSCGSCQPEIKDLIVRAQTRHAAE